jgi:crossover junction endodeoxyribonuclease RusA
MVAMRLELPFPPRSLSPNARVHWAQKAKAAKSYKTSCFYLAKEVGIHQPFLDIGGDIFLRIEWHPKTANAFDQDNAIASLKAGLDGLALAWSVNDSRFRLDLQKMPPVKGGKVVINA